MFRATVLYLSITISISIGLVTTSSAQNRDSIPRISIPLLADAATNVVPGATRVSAVLNVERFDVVNGTLTAVGKVVSTFSDANGQVIRKQESFGLASFSYSSAFVRNLHLVSQQPSPAPPRVEKKRGLLGKIFGLSSHTSPDVQTANGLAADEVVFSTNLRALCESQTGLQDRHKEK